MKTKNLTDEQLMLALAAGRKAALAELARRYERPLLGFARGYLSTPKDQLASDAVQETWLRVIRYAGSFNGNSSLKAWLYRVLINQCRDLIRTQSSSAATGEASSRHDPNPGPAGAAENAELADRLRLVVAELPPDTRLVVLLCYHGGMTHERAAEILEIPLGTLKSRLHTALRELRERLAVEI